MIAWFDLETTGLSLDCSIVEVACAITDDHYFIVDEFDMIVRPTIDTYVEPYALEMHKKSGLWDEVEQTEWKIDQADFIFSQMLKPWAGEGKLILGGSSVHFDHGFISKYMPRVDKHLSHRHLDVSTLKIFTSNFTGVDTEELPPMKALTKHRAMDDIKASIEAARWYKDNLTDPNTRIRTILTARALKQDWAKAI